MLTPKTTRELQNEKFIEAWRVAALLKAREEDGKRIPNVNIDSEVRVARSDVTYVTRVTR